MHFDFGYGFITALVRSLTISSLSLSYCVLYVSHCSGSFSVSLSRCSIACNVVNGQNVTLCKRNEKHARYISRYKRNNKPINDIPCWAVGLCVARAQSRSFLFAMYAMHSNVQNIIIRIYLFDMILHFRRNSFRSESPKCAAVCCFHRFARIDLIFSAQPMETQRMNGKKADRTDEYFIFARFAFKLLALLCFWFCFRA